MSDNLNIRVPDGYLKSLDEKAKIVGMNRTDYVMKALELTMNFDEFFLEKVKKHCDNLGISESMFIENMLIKRFAEDDARREVDGPGQVFMDEFLSVDMGTGYEMITGEELYKILKDRFLRERERARVKDLMAREHYLMPLSDGDKALLIKHRQGRVWLESAEYAAEMELQKEIKKFLGDEKE